LDRILIPLFLLAALVAILAFKKRRKQITASVVSLVFCCLLIELFLRIFSPQINESTGLFETDKILGWRFIPSTTGSIVYQGEARHYIKTNSLGFRDDEPEPGKDVIMVLGDSFVANIAVKHDEVFTEVMEQELENASVMNFGVSGYAQTQEYLILERFAKQFHPKLVFVVLYVRNDFLDNIGGYWLFPRPKAFIDPNGEVQILIPMDAEDPKRHSMPMLELHRRMHLFHFVQNKWSNIRKGMKKPSGGVHRPAPGTPPELYLCKREFDEATELMFKTTEALIMKMDRFGKERNLPVVFVIAPTIYQVRRERWNSYLRTLGLDRNDYDPALPGKRLMKLAEKEGLSMLDLLPSLGAKRGQGEELYFSNEQHWNKHGNEVVAKLLLDFMDARE